MVGLTELQLLDASMKVIPVIDVSGPPNISRVVNGNYFTIVEEHMWS